MSNRISVRRLFIGALVLVIMAASGAPVECPDFTRGKWKTKKPAFGVEG